MEFSDYQYFLVKSVSKAAQYFIVNRYCISSTQDELVENAELNVFITSDPTDFEIPEPMPKARRRNMTPKPGGCYKMRILSSFLELNAAKSYLDEMIGSKIEDSNKRAAEDEILSEHAKKTKAELKQNVEEKQPEFEVVDVNPEFSTAADSGEQEQEMEDYTNHWNQMRMAYNASDQCIEQLKKITDLHSNLYENLVKKFTDESNSADRTFNRFEIFLKISRSIMDKTIDMNEKLLNRIDEAVDIITAQKSEIEQLTKKVELIEKSQSMILNEVQINQRNYQVIDELVGHQASSTILNHESTPSTIFANSNQNDQYYTTSVFAQSENVAGTSGETVQIINANALNQGQLLLTVENMENFNSSNTTEQPNTTAKKSASENAESCLSLEMISRAVSEFQESNEIFGKLTSSQYKDNLINCSSNTTFSDNSFARGLLYACFDKVTLQTSTLSGKTKPKKNSVGITVQQSITLQSKIGKLCPIKLENIYNLWLKRFELFEADNFTVETKRRQRQSFILVVQNTLGTERKKYMSQFKTSKPLEATNPAAINHMNESEINNNIELKSVGVELASQKSI